MPEKSSKPTAPGRLYALGGFLCAVLLAYLGVLYNTQIVHGAEYRERSVRTITRSETVEASRGIITDRSGATIVSNRQTYNLTFDSSLLDGEDDENACILRLTQLLREHSLVWIDQLPLSAEAPYVYQLDAAEATQKSRFVKFLQKKMALVSASVSPNEVDEALLISSGLPADALFADLRKKFEIPADWSDADARTVLGIRYELAVREVVNTTSYVMVEDVTQELISLLNDGGYLGARVVSSFARQYETACAAHILGSVGRIFAEDKAEYLEKGYDMDDQVGWSGVEAAFEDYLRGAKGKRVVSTNADGKITGEYYSIAPEPGGTVQLTIDLPFQQAVETALAQTVSGMTAKDGIVRGAGAAVVGVGSGEILALASYPTFDPATYKLNYNALAADTEANPLFNRATSGTYAPGSTLKPCTAIAGLEEGVISTSTTIRDTGIWYYPGASTGDYFKCWYHAGHGLLNVTQAITNSCNYFFGQVGYQLGLDKLNEYASAFGLGRHTGIEIGDYTGTLATEEQGQDLAPWAAFGQASYTATPLQLANYIATLVSGGEHYPAHLLKEVKSYDNAQILYVEPGEPESDMDLSPANVNAVKQGMRSLTTGTLSAYFKNCVVDAGAKTGTAQVGSQKVDNGVFVCFAPYDDPQIAVAVAIEKGGSGAALASTAVEILNAYFTADQIGAVVVGENQLLP